MRDLTKKIYLNASEQGWKYTAVKSEDTIQTFINVEVIKNWADIHQFKDEFGNATVNVATLKNISIQTKLSSIPLCSLKYNT